MKLINRSKRIISSMLVLTLILFMPVTTNGGDDVADVLCGVVLIATGAYLVYAGAAAIGAGAGITWGVGSGVAAGTGTMIVGGGYLASEGIGFLTGENNLDTGGNPTNIGNDDSQKKAFYIQIEAQPDNLPMDGASKSLITIKMRNSYGDVLDSVPAGYSILAKHTNNNAYLVDGDFASSSSRTQSILQSAQSMSISNSESSLVIPGQISTISYNLGETCQSVAMEISNSAGNTVYALTESIPNPAKPIPFTWKGTAMNGEKLPAGSYTARLKSLGPNNTVKASSTRTMSIGSPLGSTEERDITSNYISGAAYMTLTAPLIEDINYDDITVTLKDNTGKEVQNTSKKINFRRASQPPPETITQNSIPDMEVLKVVNGDILKLTDRTGDSESKIINSSDNISYIYDKNNGGYYIKEGNTKKVIVASIDDLDYEDLVEVSCEEYIETAKKIKDTLETIASYSNISFNSQGLPTMPNIITSLDGDLLTFTYEGENFVFNFADNTVSAPVEIPTSISINLDRVTALSVQAQSTSSTPTIPTNIRDKILLAQLLYKPRKEYNKIADISKEENSNTTSNGNWPISVSGKTFPNFISSQMGPRNGVWPYFHDGLDFPGTTGDDIYSMFNGTVLYRGWVNGYGKTIIIRSKIEINGITQVAKTTYGHLSEYTANHGEKVSAGAKIGLLGNTGNSTGPHLHIDIRNNSGSPRIRYNPLKFLDYSRTGYSGDSVPQITGLKVLNNNGHEVTELSGKVKVATQIKTNEKDLTLVNIKFVGSSVDKEYDYSIIPNNANKGNTRYDPSTGLFRWDGADYSGASGTLYQLPNSTITQSSDTFYYYCDTNYIANGNYQIQVGAYDSKGNSSMEGLNINIHN